MSGTQLFLSWDRVAAPVARGRTRARPAEPEVEGPMIVRRGGPGWLNPCGWIVCPATSEVDEASWPQPSYAFMFRWSARRFARRLNAGGLPGREPDWM